MVTGHGRQRSVGWIVANAVLDESGVIQVLGLHQRSHEKSGILDVGQGDGGQGVCRDNVPLLGALSCDLPGIIQNNRLRPAD